MRVHLEQEQTQEKEKFFQLRESFLDKQNDTWKLAQQCVTRQYPKKDVDMAHYLQDKYPNVNTIAKDSCFHFGYMQKKDGFESTTDGEYMNDNRHRDQSDQDDKYVTKHFDFRLNGDIDGVDRQEDIDDYQPRSRDFAYAYFRDELKAKEIAILTLISRWRARKEIHTKLNLMTQMRKRLDFLVAREIISHTQKSGIVIMSWI